MSVVEKKDVSLDAFTLEFKRLKARNPPPDLTNVLDLAQISLHSHSESESLKSVANFPLTKTSLRPIAGLRPCEEWKAFQFLNYPGFVVIQNPFISGYQRYWVARCLQDFPSDRENITNLSALGGERGQNLWHEFVKSKCSLFSKQDPLRKLRWTTLGYHYNWTTKEYSEDLKAKFPQDINCLTQYLAACLGFGTYSAEAGIVNYYHLDSTLAGHTDHSELDQSAPLFSISFGQSAIFLLGGQIKSEKPMSIYLRSGDICVMSGACRLAYHAVPKILNSSHEHPIPHCFSIVSSISEPKCFMNDVHSENELAAKTHASNQKNTTGTCDERHSLLNQMPLESVPSEYILTFNTNVIQVNENIERTISSIDFKPFEVYLSSSRINLNLRQVLPPGCTQLAGKTQSGFDGHPHNLCDEKLTDGRDNVDSPCHKSRYKSESLCFFQEAKKSRTDL